VHFAVQKHHLHLIVEAKDAEALARALRTPREVWAALRYVLLNSRRHGSQRHQGWDRDWVDPCSSGRWFDGWRQDRPPPPPGKPPPVAAAHSWLLRVGWRRHGLLSLDEVPGR
jgi:putative transposase